jgi:DNA-binding MarR family transcriptional regulator
MDIAEALKIADNLVFASRNKHLNDLERSIIEGVCQGKKYSQIAQDNYCEQSHVNDVAANLWKSVSDAVGEQVKKANFRSTLERHQSKNISSSFVEQISLVNICSEVTLNHQPNHIQRAARSNTPQYLKTIPDLVPFYRRNQELDLLKQWILTEQSKSIVISGTAGIGKTALARQLLEDIKGEFEEIVWQSLGCQRSVVEFIDRNLLASLNIEALPEPPLDLEVRLSLLLEHFREHRCLVILDDVDQLFSSGELAGNYTEEYREYRELFCRIWDTNHQSCVLLLSREEPSELAVSLGNNSSIHSLPLCGIGEGGREIFRAKGLGDEDRWDDAIDYLGGNPAYLESVSIAINKLFGGKVTKFCKYEELFLTEDIKSLLSQQFSRLSASEQVVIKFLASENIPVTIARSIESLTLSPAHVGSAIISLVRRGLVDRTETEGDTFFGVRSHRVSQGDSIIKQFTLQL